MNRQEKQDMVTFLHSHFTESPAAFLLGVKGMTVREMQLLRRNVRQEGGTVKVAKNTLLKIASQDHEAARHIHPYCEGQVAVVFAEHEPVQVAKAIKNTRDEVSGLEIRAGVVESRFADSQRLEFFASLPPRDQLLAKFCGALKGPLTSHVTALSQVTSRFARVIQQLKEHKENQ